MTMLRSFILVGFVCLLGCGLNSAPDVGTRSSPDETVGSGKRTVEIAENKTKTAKSNHSPQVSKPVPKIIPGKPVLIGNGLEPKQVLRGLRKKRRPFQRCYSKYLLVNPSAEGKVNLSFRIAVSGTVSEVQINDESSDSLGEPFRQCLVQVIQGIQFATPKKGEAVLVKWSPRFRAPSNK